MVSTTFEYEICVLIQILKISNLHFRPKFFPLTPIPVISYLCICYSFEEMKLIHKLSAQFHHSIRGHFPSSVRIVEVGPRD